MRGVSDSFALVTATSMLVVGPIPSSSLNTLDTFTQQALAAVLWIGTATCLYGTASGSRWFRRNADLVDRLENTPSWWVDFAHKADLYTDCEMDDEGEYKRAICKIVMGNQWWAGQDNIFEQIGELFAHPFVEVVAMAKAIWDAGLFFAHGTGPHVDYSVGPAIDYLAA